MNTQAHKNESLRNDNKGKLVEGCAHQSVWVYKANVLDRKKTACSGCSSCIYQPFTYINPFDQLKSIYGE